MPKRASAAPAARGRHDAKAGSAADAGSRKPAADTESKAGPRTRKGEATRRAILDTALALFAREGYHRTTVPMIVRAAGIGHGTFYDYFDSRRDILLALTREASKKLTPNRRTRSPSTLAERIRDEILWYLTEHVEDLELFKIWTDAEQFDPEVAKDRQALRDLRLARIQRAIELAAPHGVKPEIAAVALQAMLEGFVYRWYVQRNADSSPREVFEAADTLATLWVAAIGATTLERRI